MHPWTQRQAQMTRRAIKTGAGLVMRQLTFEHTASKVLNTELFNRYLREASRWSSYAPDYPLYALTRIVRPLVTVETGVLRGRSSALILAALEQNGGGFLHSIDLPTTGGGRNAVDGHWDDASLKLGEVPGCDIPDRLRSRWTLHQGSSTELLPVVLKGLGRLDMFYHDSDHSYSIQMMEYERAWEVLGVGGLLISDDINVTSAFADFARSVSRVPVRWEMDRRGFILK